MDFNEMCIFCLIFVAGFVFGLLLIDRIGAVIMHLRDLRTGRKRTCFLQRVK